MHYPFYQDVPYCTPEQVLFSFGNQKGTILLESASVESEQGRYSFMGVNPFQTITSKNSFLEIKSILNETVRTTQGSLFDMLRDELKKYALTYLDLDIPFQGGIMGYWGYELYHYLETISVSQKDSIGFNDLEIGFYDVVIAWDHLKEKTIIFSSGFPYLGNEREQYAKVRLNELRNQLSSLKTSSFKNELLSHHEIRSNFTLEKYVQAVNKVKEYILAGDIFEANISQRFLANLPAHLSELDLYKRIKKISPAPFSAYHYMNDTHLISASPERFLKLKGNLVETRPIKGTIRRGVNKEEDIHLAKMLKCSSKDHSENVMIVDLLRNDLSKVCEDFSVTVPQLCEIETYSSVHHLVSVIQGQLKPHYSAIELLEATFPGGSITGAPKIRAIEIIAEIEEEKRGPYCGCLGYIGFNGNMDTSIIIRTYIIKDRKVIFQTGGAVVLDSKPEQEYEETLLKAHSLMRGLCEYIAN